MNDITLNEKIWEKLNFLPSDTALFYLLCLQLSTNGNNKNEEKGFFFERKKIVSYPSVNPEKYREHLSFLKKEELISFTQKEGKWFIKIIDESHIVKKEHEDIKLIDSLSSSFLKEKQENQKNNSSNKKYKYSNKDMELALYIKNKVNHIRMINKKTKIEEWADIIRKMHTIDNIDYEYIRKIFDFAHQDDFWASNILSPRKLRDKFEVLVQKSGFIPEKNKDNEKLTYIDAPFEEVFQEFKNIIEKEEHIFNEEEIKIKFNKVWIKMMRTPKKYNPDETMYFDKETGIIWWKQVFNFIKNEKTNLINTDWFSFEWLISQNNIIKIIK